MKKSLESYSSKMQPLFEKVGKLTKVQRIVIGVVVFSLLIAGFVFLSIKPLYENRRD
jgi:flagellar biosynthesis/type III secretory pathway M-ring protein FliF/YscJ